MSTETASTSAHVPARGTPCPNGCAEGPRREEIVTLMMNEDREVYCPSCWDCFGVLPAHLWPCGCLINEAGAHRVGCPDHPEGVRG